MTPKIIDVTIQGNSIQITGDNTNSIHWYDQDSLIVGMTCDINVSTIDSNFVRAVLINEYGSTYTQPFGITIRNLERPTDDV
jgi:hypothetical protein